MTPMPEIRRITSRSDSFPSIGNSSSSNDDHDDEETPRNVLLEENGRLREEMELLKAKVAQLQHKLKQAQTAAAAAAAAASSTKNKNSQEKHGVVLELPATLRHSSSPARKSKTGPLICCTKGATAKEERSFSTSDGQETIEPGLEADLHESIGGLHHRSSSGAPNNNSLLLHPNQKIGTGTMSSSPQTRKTDPLSQDSLSTEDGSLDEHDDDDDNMEAQYLLSSSEPTPKVDVDSVVDEYSDDTNFYRLVSDRAGWLVGLLVLQSMSSFILARNEAMLQQHLVIIRFLTMLVGAGGNAGNQASVRVIRGLAIGAINDSNTRNVLKREVFMGLCLSLVLGIAGCIRAAVFLTPMLETIAITSSLFMIVMISIILGALMPLGMKMIGIDPAHSSTTIQVVMDILGVTITVQVSSLVLDSGFQNWLFSAGSMMGA